MNKVGDLSNEQLLVHLRAHVGRGNVWQAELMAYLAEVEHRRLELEHACPSMWDFCVRILRMSESEANLRIAGARVVRRFPSALGYLERGEVHLCAIYALRDYLTAENHEELLREASGKSTEAIRRMLAARFPRPDVPARIEPLDPLPLLLTSTAKTTAPSSALGSDRSPIAEPRPRVEPLSATRYRLELTVSAETRKKLEHIRDLMRHSNPSGSLETIVDASLDLLLAKLEKQRLGRASHSGKEKRERAKAMTNGNRVMKQPSTFVEPCEPARGASISAPETTAALANTTLDALANTTHATTALATTIARDTIARDTIAGDALAPTALDGHTSTPHGRAPGAAQSQRTTAPAKQKSARGRIKTEVRRQVFDRDGEQCTYVDADGRRCPARGALELDHVHAKALGGSDEADNLRVRCRAHNLLHAEQVFGRAYVEEQIRLRRRTDSAASGLAFETVARGLRSLGFSEPEVRRALTTLRGKLDTATPVETILRQALALLT